MDSEQTKEALKEELELLRKENEQLTISKRFRPINRSFTPKGEKAHLL